MHSSRSYIRSQLIIKTRATEIQDQSLRTMAVEDVNISPSSPEPDRLSVRDAPHTARNASPSPARRDFESSDLYRNVYAYVQDYMKRYDASHDFQHVLRVLALAKRLLAAEQAANPDRRIHRPAVILGALLHDVGDHKYRTAEDETSPEGLVTALLAKNGCPPRFVAKVSLIVENVSYSHEIKRPQLVGALVAAHPELAIVQDADRLDAIGAVGIARTFAFGAVKQADRGLQGSIDHFVEKLERLESMMKTPTGRQLAAERTRRLRDFRGWWEDETNESLAE